VFLCQLAEIGAVFELLEQIERQFLFFTRICSAAAVLAMIAP
jgi:hypothetical protein